MSPQLRTAPLGSICAAADGGFIAVCNACDWTRETRELAVTKAHLIGHHRATHTETPVYLEA